MVAAALGNTAMLLLLLAEKADVNVLAHVRLTEEFCYLYCCISVFTLVSLNLIAMNTSILKLGRLYPRYARLSIRAH